MCILDLTNKRPFACGGLFRPIRLQHNWLMTTSFTCSTGLGDKLMPPLLPGMFRLLFARIRSERDGERESCVSQMMTRGIKAPRGAILSPEQSAAARKMCMSAFCSSSLRERKWRLTLPPHSPSCKTCTYIFIYISVFYPPATCIKAHFIQIFSRAAVPCVFWLMMQIFLSQCREKRPPVQLFLLA